MAKSADAKVVSCVNLKGGVGKTAVAVNFAAYCGREGLKTLLIDLDPQTNATFSCMSPEDWEEHAKKFGTVADLLGLRQHTKAEGKTKTAKDVLKSGIFGSIDLIPSHLDLFTIDLDLGTAVAREKKLRQATKEIIDDYDIVVCDCPPNLTIPTQNALAVSTHYVVPVSPDYLSGIGIALLLSRVSQFSKDLEHPIEHAGIVMSRVGRQSYFRSQSIQTLRAAFGAKVFNTEIMERSAVAEAAAKAKSIFDMNDAKAAGEFASFSHELLKAIGVK